MNDGASTVYTCAEAVRGVAPGNGALWQRTKITRPFPEWIEGQSGVDPRRSDQPWWSKVQIHNEDPRRVGFVSLEAVTASYLTLKIEGDTFSKGGGFDGVRRYGGFNYGLTIFGQPQSARSRTITAYHDYNVTLVLAEQLTEPFDDHLTYQAAHHPFALSFAIEVFKNGVSLGKVAADGTDVSGDTQFGVDFERGRVTLKDLGYQDFVADNAVAHLYSSGGTAQTTGTAFSVELLAPVVPQSVLQSRREGDSVYTFTGLTLGQSYDIRLTFADPTSTKKRSRVFSVFAQGEKVIEGLDIFAKVRRFAQGYQETLSGIAPDVDGNIVLNVTQHDPVNGLNLPECVQENADEGTGAGGVGGLFAPPILSAIEVLDNLSGGSGAVVAVNCGGAAITTTPPIIAADYAYSPVQEQYQAQQFAVDNPLLATQP